MIKVQKLEEISFAFAAVGRDLLFILSWRGTGQIVHTGLSARRLPASKAPSAAVKQQIIISPNNATQFIFPRVFSCPYSGLKHLCRPKYFCGINNPRRLTCSK